jgi:YD repeat-containing protein
MYPAGTNDLRFMYDQQGHISGEEFAYSLQTRQRAILVGEDGWRCSSGTSYRLDYILRHSFPLGVRSIQLQHKLGGVKVTPDISVPGQAFKVAYKLALKSILASLGESASGPFRF